MSDLSFLDPPIEIAATRPRLDMLLSRLKGFGLRAYPANPPIDFTAPEPLLIDLESVDKATLERCAKACMAGHTRQLILLDPSDSGITISDAIVIRRDRDLTILKARLAAMARRDTRAREVARRRETAVALGATPPKIDPENSPHLLYLGDGSDLFLALQGALKERGLSITAALSLLTAQDYMLSRRFCAAIVDLSPRARDVSAFVDWASPDGAQAGVSLFVLVDPAQTLSDIELATMAKAAEVIFTHEPSDIIAARIERHARQYMVSAPVVPQAGLSSTIADLTTGFFSRRFLELHLEKQMRDAELHAQTLSTLTFKLRDGLAHDLKALQALGDCVRPNLRETDCPAVIGAGTIAISLLATPYRGGVSIAERISLSIARHSKLDASMITWRVVEKRAYHTPATLLGAGIAGPFTRAATLDTLSSQRLPPALQARA